MKRYSAFAAIFVLLSVLIFTPCSRVSAEETPADGMTSVLTKGDLSFYANAENGEVALINTKSGISWKSNPEFSNADDRLGNGQKRLMSAQLEILYYDTKNSPQERNSAVASVAKGGLSFSKTGKGCSFVYDFPDDKISVTLEYELNDSYLSVKVPKDGISEKGGNRLLEISVLPYFGCGSFDDSGTILLPDGCGTLIEMNNGKSSGSAIHERIYGSDAVASSDRLVTERKNMQFPVFGIGKNGNGLLALIESGDGSSYINAYTAGMKKNYNCAYFSFEYRSTGTVVLDGSSKNAKTVRKISDQAISTDFCMRYYLTAAPGDYNSAAAAYRAYLEKEHNFKANEKQEELPFYFTAYGALRRKGTVCFIPMTVTVPLTTYSQARKMITDIENAGISNLIFSYAGWEKGGVSGKMPTAGKYEGKLGGKKDFIRLAEYARDNGITFLPDVNTVRLMQNGNGFTKNSASAATLDGTPGLQYAYSLSSGLKNADLTPYCLLAPKKYVTVLEKYFKKYNTSVLTGISLRELGSMLYSDHHKGSTDRDQALKYAKKALDYAAGQDKELLTSGSFGYAAEASDYIISAPTSDSGYDITDRSVPFYQLVLSGYRSYSTEPVNLSGNPEKALLKAAETGSALNFSFTAQNSEKTEGTYLFELYNSDYNDWLPIAADQYKRLSEIFKATGGTALVGHNKLADGVYCSVFENGAQVITNYTNSDYDMQGIQIAKMNYKLIRQGEQK